MLQTKAIHREHEHDDKRQKNGERQRGKLRKPGLKRLLNRPDERHTEKCEGYGFKQWPRKVKRSGYQKDRKKKLDAVTGFKATGFGTVSFIFCPLFNGGEIVVGRVIRCRRCNLGALFPYLDDPLFWIRVFSIGVHATPSGRIRLADHNERQYVPWLRHRVGAIGGHYPVLRSSVFCNGLAEHISLHGNLLAGFDLLVSFARYSTRPPWVAMIGAAPLPIFMPAFAAVRPSAPPITP